MTPVGQYENISGTELSKIVEEILEPYFDEDELSTPDWTPEWDAYQRASSRSEKLILDWHDKQVEEVLDRLENNIRTGMVKVSVLDYIEAERNELKGSKNDQL